MLSIPSFFVTFLCRCITKDEELANTMIFNARMSSKRGLGRRKNFVHSKDMKNSLLTNIRQMKKDIDKNKKCEKPFRLDPVLRIKKIAEIRKFLRR